MITIELDEVVETARRNTGLEDFGDEAFLAPLGVLIDSVNTEANLKDSGIEWERSDLVHALELRLQAHKFFAEYPEILGEPMTAPIVIVGPQRSGTSKLYRVVAADPQWTKLYTWQAMFPVPLGDGRPTASPDPRIAVAEEACKQFEWLQAAHEVDPRAPEMEAHIMNFAFMTNSPRRLVPTHQRYCETADHTPVYRWLNSMLQFVQWQNNVPARRWILKSPPHLLSLEALSQQYPDATLVMTHRHPVASVASMFKLVELAQGNTARSVDRGRIRDAWLRILSLNLQRFLEFRDAHGDGKWVDVPYSEVRNDSLKSVERIYQHAGAEVSQETIDAVQRWESENPQHKKGAHNYALQDYGLTADDVDREFAEYITRFGDLF